MLWQEDPIIEQNPIPTCIDVAFSITCPTLPTDHAYTLSQAIQQILTWFKDEPYTGLHLIRGAESGNGWQRPDSTTLYLSHRTKLILRIPHARLTDVQQLTGHTLDIEGHRLQIGKSTQKALLKMPVLFARYVIADAEQTEDQFLQTMLEQLQQLDIVCRKALCGKTDSLKIPEGQLFTRSLMLADLSAEDSIELQQQGLGSGRHMGCGIFVPHKDIKAVSGNKEE